jgi:hypothetical protein
MTNEYEKYVKRLYEKVDNFQFFEEDEDFNKHFKIWNYFDYDDALERLDGVKSESVRLTKLQK